MAACHAVAGRDCNVRNDRWDTWLQAVSGPVVPDLWDVHAFAQRPALRVGRSNRLIVYQFHRYLLPLTVCFVREPEPSRRAGLRTS